MFKLKSLGFNNIGLISRHVSSIVSRKDVNTSVWYGDIHLSIPLIASPMPDIGNANLVTTIRNLGGFGYIHRFQSIADQIHEHIQCPKDVGCAIGINGDYFERFEELYARGCRYFCLDTANGANTKISEVLTKLHSTHHDIHILVGNVASAECFSWLSQHNVQAIRCGIGTGSACTTKIETGLEYPPISSLLECVKSNVDTQIVLDGGIKQPRDLCKGLALGADLVMVGGILAGTEEASGRTLRLNGKLHKVFRGSASYSTQWEQYEKRPEFVEGEEQLVEYIGPLHKIVHRFINGLRSSMSYMNAKSLEEYRRHTDYCIL